MYLIRAVCVILLLGCLTGCDRDPSFPPPAQRPAIATAKPGPDAMMVAMGSAQADQAIIKDIYGGTGISWRWTKKEPTVRALVIATDHIKYSVDYALWDDSFKVTGPVEVSFLVNGRLLGRVRDTTPGLKHFEKLVPNDWLKLNTEATVGLSVDKVYVPPGTHSEYGVILTRLGLKP